MSWTTSPTSRPLRIRAVPLPRQLFPQILSPKVSSGLWSLAVHHPPGRRRTQLTHIHTPHSPSFLSFGPECGMQRALSEHYSPWGRWAWCRGIESGCLHLLPGIQAQGRPELASAPTSHLQPPGPTRAGVPHQGRALLLLHPYGWKAGVQWGLNLPGPAGVFGADRPPTLFPSHLLPPRSTGEWVRPTD